MSDQFHTTQWSVVVAAGQNQSDALETLCQSYWFPVYAFVRRRIQDEHQAQDLTQGFFTQFLARSTIGAADRDRGKFRAFLLTACKRFLANEHEREGAQKRGGGIRHFSIDFGDADGRYAASAIDDCSADDLFERQWAMSLMQSALQKLRSDYSDRKREDLFEALKQRIVDDGDEKYVEIASRLQLSEAVIKAEVHRLRSRYRELIRSEIAQTVASEEDVEAEIRTLFAALAK